MNYSNQKTLQVVSQLRYSHDISREITFTQFEQDLTQECSHTDTIKKIRSSNNKDEQDKLKLTLPGLLFQCTVSNKIRKKDNITEFTGLLFIEEDGCNYTENGKIIPFIDHQEAINKRNEVISEHFKYIKYAYDSPRQRNHYIIRVNGLTKDNYISAYKAIAKQLGICADPNGINCVRLATLSYDKNAFINNKDNDAIEVKNLKLRFEKKVKIQAKNITKLPKGVLPQMFKQSTADVHLKDFFEENKDDMIYFEEYGYACIVDKKSPVLRLKGLPSKLELGERQSGLFYSFSFFIALNGCHYKKEELYSMLKFYNTDNCIEPLPEDELYKLFNRLYSLYIKNELNIDAVQRQGAWTSKTPLKGRDKISIANKVRGQLNIIKFIKKVGKLGLSKSEFDMTSIKDMALLTGMNIKTVAKYCKLIIEDEQENAGGQKGRYIHYIYKEGLQYNGIFVPIEKRIKNAYLSMEAPTQAKIAVQLDVNIKTIKRHWKNVMNNLEEKKYEINKIKESEIFIEEEIELENINLLSLQNINNENYEQEQSNERNQDSHHDYGDS